MLVIVLQEVPLILETNKGHCKHNFLSYTGKYQGVFVKHYGMPPVATKSKKLFLASRSKSRSQGH